MVEFVAGEFAVVHLVPAVGDVGQDEGDEERDVEHCSQGELAAAGVFERQRRLQISCGGIVGRVVPSGTEQQA